MTCLEDKFRLKNIVIKTDYDPYSSNQMKAFLQGHEGYNPQTAGSKIFLHACDEDMKPKQKK